MRGWDDGRRGGRGYYTREVFDDPANSPLYLIDFDVILGTDLFNKINNPNSFSNTELFTAEVLNGLYTIYQNTEILHVIRDRFPLTNPLRNLPNITINSGDYYESVPVVGAPNANFNDLLPLTWVKKVDTFINTIGYFGFSASLEFLGGGQNFRWITNPIFSFANPNLRNKNGLDITLEMRDLDSNILEMDFLTVGILGGNEFSFSFVQGVQGPYNADYPSKAFGGTSSTAIKILDVDVSHDAAGTTNKYSISGGSPLEPLPLTFPEPFPDGRGESQGFSLVANTSTFIDLNNSALEFFIDNS